MSPSKTKNTTDNRQREKEPSSKSLAEDSKGRRTGFIIASVVIAMILIVVGAGYYHEYVAPFRRTIITVDDATIDAGYFLKRTQLADVDPMVMLESLTNEQLIKSGAPQYGIEVTPEEVNQELRRRAGGKSGAISDSEFREWYRQQLNQTGLSDSEYRDIMATSVLAVRLHDYLAERVPTIAEQVHLHAIVLGTYEDAERARTRWEGGEDFADLATEMSIDTQSREQGGNLGWLPRGILGAVIDDVVFALDPDDVSEPVQTEQEQYCLFMVSEKDAAREIDEDSIQRLGDRALNDWLSREAEFHDVTYNFDSEIYAWMKWQLSKE